MFRGTEKVNYFTVGFLNQEGLTTDYGYSNAPTLLINEQTLEVISILM